MGNYFKDTALFLKILILLLLLAYGCSGDVTDSPSPPTATSPPPPTETLEPSPVPTAEPIPMEELFPLHDLAVQTAAELLAADRIPRDEYRLAKQFKGLTQEEMIPEIESVEELEINDRIDFYILLNPGTNEYKSTPARLRHISDNAYWWTSVSARVDDEDILAASERFEEVVFPINRLAFGKEWSPGIDDDPRIHILLVEESSWGNTYGYFGRNNEYSTSISSTSNQKEMFVINVGAVRIDSDAFAGELAHEYQHLIHWNKDRNEDLWMNEAMAELAKFFTGTPLFIKVRNTSNAVIFAENPNIQLTSRPERRYGDEDRRVLAHYAAEQLFSVYLVEQFGPEFINNLVNNPAPGVISIQQELDKLPGAPEFNEIYASWILANLLNQPNLVDGRYGYIEIKPELPEREVINSFRGEPVTDALPPYGTRYYEIRADQDVQVTFSGPELAPLTLMDPASGQFAWYSNRGDETEFSLTREFDLSGIESATLKYKVWYELEEFWDFAHVEVSTDSGETWEILETTHGTDLNPNHNSYGWGYTGTALDWLSEEIDLTPYAGQVVLLRFEVLNDFSTNRDGLMLDDIEIPEISFYDGAEDDSAGWEAQGFIRSSNYVPVEWIVWLLKLAVGEPTIIERIDVVPGQQETFEISGFIEEYDFAALVVSPAAPVTTMELDYELVFEYP
jgi:hypothetical protein